MVPILVKHILNGFETYRKDFAQVTRRARSRFEARDWKAGRQDTIARLDIYGAMVNQTCDTINARWGDIASHKTLWEEVKTAFFEKVKDRPDGELACTFYNSVNRKVLKAISFEPRLSFVDPPDIRRVFPSRDTFRIQFQISRITDGVIKDLLARYHFATPFKDISLEARLCSAKIAADVPSTRESGNPVVVEMIRAPFFRGMAAYLVGRLRLNGKVHPLVFSIHNTSQGLQVDALLTDLEDVRVLFSFARAYFHVETQCPGQVVAFLKELMPHKRTAELYIGLGYHKHGKTELYRDLLEHQKVCSQDRFDIAPGKPGMVMIAFNMPNDDLIYKLIRDRFDAPKKTTAREVMDKYAYVFKHDRAGRLLDVQTFENLELEDCCFTPRLLQEIGSAATRAVTISDDGRVVLEHAYVERRVVPLDIYLQSAAPRDARAAVMDYGQAIKDLARVDIFPGDLLLKNFGVTNLGRVVFYDYDELRPLTECRFRRLPEARRYEDALEADPWFMVAENDVFPEEIGAFLGLAPELHQVFLKHHGDLLTPEFWWAAQDQLQSGNWIHIRPYGDAQRLHGVSPHA